MAQIFRINLKTAHEKTGLSYYMVAKRTGVSPNTAQKYAENVVDTPYIPAAVIVLADFYGVDWRASEIVEVIDVEGDEESPEMETPLLTA